MLLAGLHGHAESPLAIRIDGRTNDTSRHFASKISCGGQEASMWTSVPKWYSYSGELSPSRQVCEDGVLLKREGNRTLL